MFTNNYVDTVIPHCYPARMRKGKGVLSVVGTKIAKYRDLGIEATRKHDETGEKLASVCFNSFGTAYERHK